MRVRAAHRRERTAASRAASAWLLPVGGEIHQHQPEQDHERDRRRDRSVIDVGGVPYLADFGDEETGRVFGWYYGYPSCCVEAHVARIFGGDLHPLGGHVLCPACVAGPMASLPPRPAESYGFLREDDYRILEYPPSPYAGANP